MKIDSKTSVAMFERTQRYKGRGRPRKTDFSSYLMFMDKDGVYRLDGFEEGKRLRKEEMIDSYKKGVDEIKEVLND